MAKQLNVELHMTANTRDAQSQIKQLNMQLQKIQTTPTKLFDDQNLKQASQAAKELQMHLQSATNVDTGKINLYKFASNLNSANKKLDDYRIALGKIGPEGQKAFLSVANSITNAEAPTLRLTKRMEDFLTTLKNTARWQISSTVLHSFMGSLQKAYGYAKDLDSSLNNIRIVTGQTSDEMAKFALQANRSAKELSTTTTAYTDAALIFYQQGLADKAVKERTDAVIKMANVTKDSETEVSSYMTAIWNNFSGEKKNLEEYADVITALGAATASSSAEIAGGLEKFAAIGQQIGLSYDYATTALATVVANTRQSEDVVGTAFKTIFARIQGLSLGETLEDGTDLTKYSKALAAVGVQIKDSSGELKDMDIILDDLGNRWQGLTRDQQVALAQTVAGTRQYTQLVALMDTWQTDFQNNLKVAQGSEGSLNEQAALYADSWEAARDKVRASAESIYKDLIDEEFFKSVDKIFAGVLDGVNGFIKGLGGIKGLVGSIGGLVMQYFAKETPDALDRIKQNLVYITGLGKTVAQNLQKEASMGMENLPVMTDNAVWNTQVEAARNLSAIKSDLLNKQKDMSAAEKEAYDFQIKQVEESYKILEILAEEVNKKNEIVKSDRENMSNKGASNNSTSGNRREFEQNAQDINLATDELQGYVRALAQIEQIGKNVKSQAEMWEKNNLEVDSLKEKVIEYIGSLKNSGKIDTGNQKYIELTKTLGNAKATVEEIISALKDLGAQNGTNGMDSAFKAIDEESKGAAQSATELGDKLDEVWDKLSNEFGIPADEIKNMVNHMREAALEENNLNDSTKALNGELPIVKQHVVGVSESLMSLGGYLSSVSGFINSIKSLGDIFSDKDAGAIEKITAVLGTLTSALFLYNALKRASDTLNKTGIGLALSDAAAKGVQATATEGAAAAQWSLNAAMEANPFGLILVGVTALIGAFVAVASAMDYASKAGERAAEAVSSASESYNETKDEIDSLNGELKTTQDRLKELYKLAQKGPLTITSQKELAQLEAKNAALEAQLKLKEQLASAQYGEIAITAAEAANKNSFGTSAANDYISNSPWVEQGTGMFDGQSEVKKMLENATSADDIQAIKDVVAEWRDAGDKLAETQEEYDALDRGFNLGELTESQQETYLNLQNQRGVWTDQSYFANQLNPDDFSKLLDDQFTVYTSELGTGYQKAVEYLPALLDRNVNGVYDEQIAYYQDISKKFFEATNKLEETSLSGLESSGVSLEDAQAIHNGDKNFADLTESQKKAFTDYANSLGLSTDDMITSLKEWDGEIVYTNAILDEAVEEMSQTSTEVYNLAKGLKEDSSISAEDYSKLSEIQQTYFSLMLDGTYKLTGDAQEFYDLVHSQMISDTQQKMSELSDRNINLNRVKDYDFNTISQNSINEKGEYNQNTLNQQLDFLETTGYDSNIIQGWKDDAGDLSMNTQSLEDIANAVAACESAYNSLGDEIDANTTSIREMDLAIALSYDDFDDLRDAYDEGTIGAEAFTQAQEEMLEAERLDGLDAEKVKDYAEYLEDTVPELKDNKEAAKDLSIQINRMNKGIDDLANGWEDWSSVLKKSSEDSEEYCSAMSSMKDSLSDVLDISSDFMSNDFVKDNLDDIKLASEGNADAIDRLREASLDDIVVQVAADFDGISEEELSTKVDNLQSLIDNMYPDGITMGTNIDDSGFVDACNEMILAAGMSADEVNALFSGMGYDVNFAKEPQEVTTEIPEYVTHHEIKNESEDGKTYDEVTWTEQTGSHTEKGTTDTFAMQTSEPGTTVVPTISSVTKKASGASNNYSSSNKGGKGPGKSSGGGDKDKTTKDEKKFNDENDRYHEIKEELSEIDRQLNKISKASDRAWGPGKIASLNRETQALDKQIDALKRYGDQLSTNMAKDRQAAEAAGWVFDSNGYVTNYEATLQGLMNAYNAAVQAYNAAAAGSEEEKAASKQLEKAQKTYDEAKKALSTYESTREEFEKNQDSIRDKAREKWDKDLEKIEYKVEFKLDLDDRQLKLLEDIMKDFGDSADHALDKIEGLEKGINNIFTQVQDNKNAISESLGFAGANSSDINGFLSGGNSGGIAGLLGKALDENSVENMGQVVSDIQQYTDNLLDLNEQLRTYREQVYDVMTNAMSEFLEDLGRAEDKIEHTKTLTQGYKDIIDAVGKANIDASGKITAQLNKALEAETKDAYDAALAKEKYAQTAYQSALDVYKSAVQSGDEYAIQKSKEILEQAEDDLADAAENSQSKLQEMAEVVAQTFSDEIAQVISDLNVALGNLTQLREQFNQAKELDAQYLDDYQKIYELSKLTRQVQQSIDETDNVAAKKALMEYQEKINAYQKDGVEMSQYELDYLQKQYDLEVAKITLEEAQNAKSQVSMVQDSEGNYSYVYTADDQAVQNAQQSYEDKLYAMQELNAQYINDLQENILTMQEELSAKLQEIADDDSLSLDEKAAKMDEITAYYLERVGFYSDQLEIVLDNNKELYEIDWTDYSIKTGYKISANKDYLDSWEETTLGVLSGVTTQSGYMENLENAVIKAKETAKVCCEETKTKLSELGLSTEEYGKKVDEVAKQLIQNSKDASQSAQNMAREYETSIIQIGNAVSSFNTQYAAMIQNMINNNQNLINSMNLVMQQAYSMMAVLTNAGMSSGGSGESGNEGSDGSGGGVNASSRNNAMAIYNKINAGNYGNGRAYRLENATADGYTELEYKVAQEAINDVYPTDKGGRGTGKSPAQAIADWAKTYGFNTGGYTGEWGSNGGRLAILHQKELVLNAEDTSNMLEMVDMVRRISNVIDVNALSSMVTTGLSSVTANMNNDNTLEQEVHITAEFPNATNKQEILEAFDNVINLASQYANRK